MDPTGPATGGDSGYVIDSRFELLEEIGAGAMGRVYRAKQLSLGVVRALKVIGVEGGAAEEAARARFRREALAMSRLQHPGIAQIIEFGTLPNGTYFLVMEYIEGEDLQRRVETSGPLSLRESVEILARIAEAVAYAQSQGIVHRDLKPANVLLAQGDVSRVKVIDFGLAKLLTEEQITQLTADEQMLGTPIFMSPEQCLSQEIGAPTDVYALAGIAYHLISGRPVFFAESLPKIILAQIYQEPEPLSERCPELVIPPALDALLLGCLAKDPGARPTTSQVVDGLRRLAPGIGHQASVVLGQPAPAVDLARTVLSQSDVLASSLWLTVPASTVTEHEVRTALQEALFNQITDQVNTLAAKLEAKLGLSATLGELRGQLEAVQGDLTDAEMDLALVEAELSEPNDSDATANTDRLLGRGRELRARIYELLVEQNRQYRNLFRYVVRYQGEVPDPDLQSGFTELEELIQEFLGAGGRV